MSLILTILALIPFYLLGAFPTGYLLAKAKGVDITSEGSGNVGATNVARTLGKSAGIITLLCDIAKGFFGVYIASLIGGNDFTNAAAIALVAGHCISLPPKLKGGKGVATTLGVILYLNQAAAIAGVGFFIIVFSISRIVSAASLVAALIVPLAAIFLGADNNQVISLGVISLIVLIRHKANLQRLVEGREKKFKISN